MRNFIIRLLTAIVYSGTIIFSIIYSKYTFLALFTIIIILCSREFYNMMNLRGETKINPYIHGAGGAILFITIFLFVSGITERYIFSLYFIYIAGTLIYELYSDNKNPINRLAYIILGQCYVALPFSALNLLAFPDFSAETPIYQWIWIIALFVIIWANDTGAYLIGVTFGKHRLWEKLSPKKSWEGFFGGFIFAIIFSLIFAHFQPQIAWYHWVVISIGIVIFSTYGDFVESMIKRSVAIKDSGNLLPGHGGFLDRFDSLLLAVYAMLFYMQFFIQN